MKLEFDGNPISVKHRVLSYGLRKPVRKALDPLVSNGALEPATSFKRVTQIVTPFKGDGKTLGICEYRITLNPMLRQQMCLTEEPFFSRLDLKDAYLQGLPHRDCRELTVTKTFWSIFS